MVCWYLHPLAPFLSDRRDTVHLAHLQTLPAKAWHEVRDTQDLFTPRQLFGQANLKHLFFRCHSSNKYRFNQAITSCTLLHTASLFFLFSSLINIHWLIVSRSTEEIDWQTSEVSQISENVLSTLSAEQTSGEETPNMALRKQNQNRTLNLILKPPSRFLEA